MTPAQFRMARSGLKLTNREISKIAMVGTATIFRFESGGALKPRTLLALRRTLEGAGAVFVDQPNMSGVLVPKAVDAAGGD